MKKLLFALTLLAGSAFGQSAVINNFTALIKGVTIGTSHCYFWGQSPGASQVQAACYTNGVILKNTIQTVTTPNDEQCFGIGGTPPNFIPVSMICWQFKPDAISPGIDYQITGLGTTGGNATITGTF